MSGTVTGDGICATKFFLRYFDAGIPTMQAFRDASYELDAPTLIVAGSCVRDEFGPGADDWFPRESWTEREPE